MIHTQGLTKTFGDADAKRALTAVDHISLDVAEGEVFEERDATQSQTWKAELMDYTHGTGVVPTIVRSSGEPRIQVGFPPGRG